MSEDEEVSEEEKVSQEQEEEFISFMKKQVEIKQLLQEKYYITLQMNNISPRQCVCVCVCVCVCAYLCIVLT